MTVPVHVNIVMDPTAGILSHYFLFIPPPAPPVPTFAIEMIILQGNFPGKLTGQHKVTKSVFHKNWQVILEGHDIGCLIPDITIPFTNQWYAIMWPFSKRKIAFASSTVKMNGKAVGCAAASPPFPMMTCGDPITAPTAFPLINNWNTVQVGLTPEDILNGVGAIAFSMAIDLIFFARSKSPSVIKDLGKDLFWKAVDKVFPYKRNSILKKLLGGITGVAIPVGGKSKKVTVGPPGIEVGIDTSKPHLVTWNICGHSN